jgi:hypothetical protein
MQKRIVKIFSVLLTVLILLFATMGCVDKRSPSDAKKRMEKKGYAVKVYDVNDIFANEYKKYKKYDADMVLECTDKKDVNNKVVAIYFKNKADAEIFHTLVKIEVPHEVYRQKGLWVYYGSKEAAAEFAY